MKRAMELADSSMKFLVAGPNYTEYVLNVWNKNLRPCVYAQPLLRKINKKTTTTTKICCVSVCLFVCHCLFACLFGCLFVSLFVFVLFLGVFLFVFVCVCFVFRSVF